MGANGAWIHGAIEDVGAIYHRHSGNATARGVKKAYLDNRLIATDLHLSKLSPAEAKTGYIPSKKAFPNSFCRFTTNP